jgi:hypothetical protein
MAESVDSDEIRERLAGIREKLRRMRDDGRQSLDRLAASRVEAEDAARLRERRQTDARPTPPPR